MPEARRWAALVLSALASCAAPGPEHGPPRPPQIPESFLAQLDREEARAQRTEAGQPGPPGQKPPEPPARPLESCGQSGEGFDGWLVSFKKSAAERGVSGKTIESALSFVTYDPRVIELDRSQHAFKLSFEQFSAARVTRARIARARALGRERQALLAKIEAAFGVAREVLLAIWGLETDFGENVGTMSSFRSLSTLAYDCRRSERFRGELLAALRLVERGDLTPPEMVGAWAGELGQTQFLPSSYEAFAVDFDGDGRANLVTSEADALASTASYLKGHGWREGEVYSPGSPNFEVLGEWNRSTIYRRTIALFASKIGGPKRSPAGSRPGTLARCP